MTSRETGKRRSVSCDPALVLEDSGCPHSPTFTKSLLLTSVGHQMCHLLSRGSYRMPFNPLLLFP
ncbi:hypothetical protein STEG23_012537, partial [Scotinomys teguina]